MSLALMGISGASMAVFAFIVTYKRRVLRVRGTTDIAAEPGVGARWQAGRWDSDARHAYIANLGDDTAYDVSVTEHHHVVAAAPSVPPFNANQLTPAADVPCYLNFCVHPNPAAPAPATPHRHRMPALPIDNTAPAIAVQVTWRTGRGDWTTRTVHTR
jgi:hypothetical protein